jgi:hypothetical protein
LIFLSHLPFSEKIIKKDESPLPYPPYLPKQTLNPHSLSSSLSIPPKNEKEEGENRKMNTSPPIPPYKKEARRMRKRGIQSIFFISFLIFGEMGEKEKGWLS